MRKTVLRAAIGLAVGAALLPSAGRASETDFFGWTIAPDGVVPGGPIDKFVVYGGSTLDNQGTYNVQGTLQAGPILNSGSFTQTGTIICTGPFTNTGTATIGGIQAWSTGAAYANNAGSSTFLSDVGGSSGAANLAMTISDGSVNFQSSQHLQSLSMSGGAAVLAGSGDKLIVTAGLSLSGAASLDLTDNDLIVTFTNSSPEADVQQWVKNWFTLHTGPMLQASHFNDASSAFLRTLAVSDNRDLKFSSFSGQAFAPGDFNQVLVKFTYLGDANLDGQVTPKDYAIIDGNVGLGHDWGTGDLNSDGKVNPADYAQVDGNIGAGNGTQNGGPQLAVVVPEPALAGLFGVVCLTLTRRRRILRGR